MLCVDNIAMILVFLYALILCAGLHVNQSSEITLITGFFDVGRENYAKTPRSQDQYFAYFKRWARLKNDLIVFCQNQAAEKEIMDVRKSYDLERKTKVVVIEDIYAVEKKLYDQMVKIENNDEFLEFRVGRKDWPENKAGYNYVTNMKTYFLHRAVLEFEVKTDSVAWIDFGFDHGGSVYAFEEDFSFLLQCEPSDKITLFLRKNDTRPMFEVIRTVHPDAVATPFFICPTKLVSVLWDQVRKCLYSLAKIGLMDDDQPLLLYASRMKPELFRFKKNSRWFLPIKQHCNGKHMRETDRAKKKEEKKKR